jgi:hypothetical protein
MGTIQTLFPVELPLVVIQGADWFVPFRLEVSGSPTDPTAAKSLLDTTGWTARMQIRASLDASTAALDLTTANGRLEVGFTPLKFVGSAARAVGELLIPTTPNGFIYDVTIAGSLGAAEPTSYPVALGQVVASGSAQLRCLRDDSIVTNLRIVLPAAISAAAADWGDGVYDLELLDPGGKVTRLFYGSCVMSREVTR